MKTSEQVNEIAAALAKVQGLLKPAAKDSENPAFRSKYADIASQWDAWREVGPPNGLALTQEATSVEAGVQVTTLLLHTSGQWILYDPLVIPIARKDAHGIGSGTTYGRRFTMGAATGLVGEEDDDGNGAVGNRAGREKSSPRPSQPSTGPRVTGDEGKPNRISAPTTDAEVRQAFPDDLQPVTVDARELWKQDKRDCPVCGGKGTLRKGKREYGGGVYCDRTTGCGYKWKDSWKPEPQAGEIPRPASAPTGIAASPSEEGARKDSGGTNPPPREHLIAMCRQTVKALGMSTRELQALRNAYTGGVVLDDAPDDALERLYLMLSDGEAVAQFRAELAKGAA